MKTLKQQVKDASFIIFGIGIICITLSLLSGCSGVFQGASGTNGTNGAVGAGSTGATGAQGVQGVSGTNGSNGTNGAQGYGAGITTTQLSVDNSNCPAGGIELVNFQDLNNSGIQIPSDPILGLTYVCNGIDGTNGSNGTSTSFSIVADNGVNCTNGGYDVTFTDASGSQTEYLCNGANGSNGQAGLDGTNGSNGGTVTFDLVQAIEPCGAASSPWKEVLLGLQGGQILSAFSETESGQDTRLSFIPNGTYEDTDESGCNFTVAGDGATWSSISWAAGTNQYSTWPAGGFDWAANTGWIAQ